MPTVQYPLLAGADLRRETTFRILEDLNRLRAFTEPREARLRNVPGIRSTLRHLPDKDRLFSRRWACIQLLAHPCAREWRG
jgi:hypothetical protein